MRVLNSSGEWVDPPDDAGRRSESPGFVRRFVRRKAVHWGFLAALVGASTVVLWLHLPTDRPGAEAPSDGTSPDNRINSDNDVASVAEWSKKDTGGINPEVVVAWVKAGASFGWLDQGLPRHKAGVVTDRPQGVPVVPGFTVAGSTLYRLNDLPAPEAPFGIDIANMLIDTGARPTILASLARFKHLHTLHLASTRVGDWGMKELGQLDQVKELGLQGCGPFDGAALKESVGLRQLQALSFYRGNMDANGLTDLANLPQLRYLDVGETEITDAGLKRVAEVKSLETLHLEHTRITAAGLAELAQLPNLRELHLNQGKHSRYDPGWERDSPMSQAGLQAIAKLKQLRTLSLGNGFTDEELMELANLRQLRELSFNLTGSETFVTPAGKARLCEALPDLAIK
jgi:hypothetical protein